MGRPIFLATASGLCSALPLSVSRYRGQNGTATVLQSAWLQSWLAGDYQHMRAVYRFQTSEQTVTLELPRGIEPGNTRILLNRKDLRVPYEESGPIAIPMSTADYGSLNTLEIFYSVPHRTRSLEMVYVAPPLLAGDQTPDETLWQFVLPNDQFLIAAPKELTLATLDQRQVIPWKQLPLFEQADLEEDLASSQQLPPTVLENRYLYVSKGRMGLSRDRCRQEMAVNVGLFCSGFGCRVVDSLCAGVKKFKILGTFLGRTNPICRSFSQNGDGVYAICCAGSLFGHSGNDPTVVHLSQIGSTAGSQ